MGKITKCEECPLRGRWGQPVKAFLRRKMVGTGEYREVPFRGNTEASVVLIGESPGGVEVLKGQAFVGDSGELLTKYFGEAGFDVNREAFIANACRCLIPKNELSAKELTAALACCRPAVQLAVSAIKPKLIVCLGDIAMRQVLKRQGIMRHRGRFVWSNEFKCWVVPIYHPAFCIRDSRHLALWQPDIEQIVAFVRRDFVLKDAGDDAVLEEVEGIRHILDDGPTYVAVDTETQGLDWLDPSSLVVAYSVSHREGYGATVVLYREAGDDEKEDMTITWPRRVGRKREPVAVRVVRAADYERKVAELRELLENPTIKKVMMNGNYDLLRFRQLGIRDVKNYVFDVQLAAHTYDPDNFRIASLADIQRAFLPALTDHKQQTTLDKGDMLAALRDDREQFVRYASLDAERTRRLGLVLRDRLLQDKALALYYARCAHPVTVGPLLEIQKNGLRFDASGVHAAREEVARFLRKQQEYFLRLVPTKVAARHAKAGLKLSRTQFIRDILFSKDGFGLKPIDDPKAKTATGEISTSRQLLVRLRDELDPKSHAYDALSILIAWGPHQKLYSTYLTGFLNAVKPDGRIHPNIRKATATGRTSSTDPNLQNIPKHNKDVAQVIRRLLVADKGKRLVAIDYSQNELRWIAFRSRDQNFMRVYQEGGDIHEKTALSLLGVASKDAVDPSAFKAARTAAKSVNFGFVYGMSAKGFLAYARDNYGLSLSMEEAEAYRNAFFTTYAGLPAWHKREIDYAREHGFVRTPFGAVRRLPNIGSSDPSIRAEAERRAINTPIQAAGNDATLLAADEAMRRGIIDGKKAKLVLFIHDELIFEVEEDWVPIFVPQMVNMMRSMHEVFLERFGLRFDVRLEADATVGKNLAEMKDFEEGGHE